MTISPPPSVNLESLLDPAVLLSASEEQLADTAAAIVGEQRRRAAERYDLDALIETAFEEAFDGRGVPSLPYLRGAYLICPGSVRQKSALSHDCTHVSVDGVWVWESEEFITEDVRHVPGAKLQQRSVSIVGAVEGLTFDVVNAAKRSGGPCEMKSAHSFVITRGEIEQVATRARKPNGHR